MPALTKLMGPYVDTDTHIQIIKNKYGGKQNMLVMVLPAHRDQRGTELCGFEDSLVYTEKPFLEGNRRGGLNFLETTLLLYNVSYKSFFPWCLEVRLRAG